MGADRRWMNPGACVLAAAVALLPATGAAQPQSIALAPGGTEVTLRAYVLGMMPTEGAFAKFRGRIDFDPATPGRCRVELTAETSSLVFAEDSVREEVLSPAFLDAAGHPSLTYQGACAAGTLQGTLALHGETHPFTLALSDEAGRLVAAGMLDRTQWGITGRRLMVGASVRIEVAVTPQAAQRGVLPALLAGAAR